MIDEAKIDKVSYELTGTLQMEGDESSSSDEEEESFGDAVISTAANCVDSDEELEVFGSPSPIVAPIKITTAFTEPPNTVFVSQKSHPASLKEPLETGTIDIVLPNDDHDVTCAPSVSHPNDDEFDWDDSRVAETYNHSKNPIAGANNSIAEILENEKRKENNNVIDFAEDIRQFNVAVTQNVPPETNTEVIFGGSQEESIILNLHKEAKLALQDVVGVYGEGLGDQSVLLEYCHDNTKVDIVGEKNDQQTYRPNDKLHVIAEEECEESEDEVENYKIKHETISEINRNELNLVTPMEDIQSFNEIDRFGEDFDVDKSMAADNSKQLIFHELSYSNVLEYFCGLDLSSFNSKIRVENNSKSWLNSVLSVKLSYDGSQDDLKLPFLIAEVDYDPYDEFHLNILRSLYYFFLPNQFSELSLLQPLDKRWELLGFQGSDPRTDLNRSMKCLSLLQLRRFAEKEPKLVRSLFELSKCSSSSLQTRKEIESSWPFLCVGIMFTKEALSALRSGSLHNLCNKYKSSLEAMHHFYEACFIEFGKLLLKYPLSHHAIHLSTIRRRCENDISKIMKHIFDRKAAKYIIDNSLNLPTSGVDNLQFSNLEDDGNLSNDVSSAEPQFGSRAKNFIA